MFLIKRENGKISLTVTNTKDHSVQHFEDITEEEAKNPEKFVSGSASD